MIVCHCERVSERTITRALHSGCSTVGAVAQATNAGRGCGGCVASVKRLIEEHFCATAGKEPAHEAA